MLEWAHDNNLMVLLYYSIVTVLTPRFCWFSNSLILDTHALENAGFSSFMQIQKKTLWFCWEFSRVLRYDRPPQLHIDLIKWNWSYILSNENEEKIVYTVKEMNDWTAMKSRIWITGRGEKILTLPFCPRSGSRTIQDLAFNILTLA